MQVAFQQPLIADIQMEEEPYAHAHGYQAMNNHIPVIPPPNYQVPIAEPPKGQYPFSPPRKFR